MRIPGKIDNIISVLVCAAFFLQPFSQSNGYAQELVLPVPGTMVDLSVPAVPALLKGIKVHPENPFQLEFILDKGAGTGSAALKAESTKLIKYFLTSLTVPEKDLWVNLSPYEKDRIVPESFGQTEMGRDLLAQDYLLKQITASLVYPEGDLGKQFWKRVYELSGEKNVPVNTFNKVWIVPGKAVVYENAKAGTAYVVESSLKVMTEQDYLATSRHEATGPAAASPVSSSRHPSPGGVADEKTTFPLALRSKQADAASPVAGTTQIVRNLVVPQLTKEVNTGANFAQLRQVYNSLILATWYKKKIQDNIITQIYADKNKIKGTEFADPLNAKTIYERYLQAFKKGTYNFIKEEKDPLTSEMVPRKYFSGGWSGHVDLDVVTNPDAAMTNRVLSDKSLMRINLILQSSTQDPAMQSLREKHFVKRFIRVSGRNVRISEIFNVPLTTREEQAVIDKIQHDPNFKVVLLKEDVLKDALAQNRGRIQLVLNEEAGIIPKNYIGSTVTLGVSVGALMKDEDPKDWKSLSEKNIVRVNPTGYLLIKVRGHYLLTFNRGALNEGELLLSPPGGGYWFADKDGRQLYYQHMALSRSLDRNEPLSMRRIIGGRDLQLFVTMFNSTKGREIAPYRELVQELVGPHSETGGVFDHVPESWRDKAMAVSFPKPIRSGDHPRGWHLSSLERHRTQWQWLRENVLKDIVNRSKRRNLKEGKYSLHIAVLGASSGEELVRSFYEIHSFLLHQGEDVSMWRINIEGIDSDLNAVEEAERRLNGLSPFVWTPDNMFKDSAAVQRDREYVTEMMQTLNSYANEVRDSIHIIRGDVSDKRSLDRFQNADLLLVNNVMQYIPTRELLLAEIDQWPAIIAIAGRFEGEKVIHNHRSFHVSIENDELYFALPEYVKFDKAQIAKSGKKLSKIDGDRGNYSFNVLEYEYLLSDEFKGLRDEIIRWGYFYWEAFRFTNPMILAFDGTELVGALKASYKDRKTVVGTGITVKPNHRLKGIGIRLFIQMTEFLKSKGIDVYRIKFENTQEAQGVARYVETVFFGNVQVVKDVGGNITEVSISPRSFDAPKAMSLLKSGDPVDAGMTAPGGIDLNADNLTLQTKSQSGQIKFHTDPALLARFKDAPGLMPVIMNIQPLDDLKIFLGL